MDGVCQGGSLGPLTIPSVHRRNDSTQTAVLGFGPLCPFHALGVFFNLWFLHHPYFLDVYVC